MDYSKYKDADPKTTIQKAKDLLSELGVKMDYKVINPVEGAYSARLEDAKHGWGVNGKGTTEEYCLASGFGEAMERFQSFYGYPWYMASVEAHKYLGFHRSPDETVMPLSCIKEKAPDVWKTMQYMWDTDSEEEMLETWKTLLGDDQASFVPYYSCRRGDTLMLPDRVISILDDSNGLAAGNTPQEALCQGFSEVVERYAQYEIILGRLIPPNISDSYLRESYPALFELIQRIEKASGHRIYVKDASLGKGFPVVTIVMVDAKKQRYHVKFGAHPTFAVALERCLTELLQGYTPGSEQEDELYLTQWEAQPKIPFDSARNLFNQFRDGTGAVADEYFAGKPSWEFVPWGAAAEFTNSKGLQYMCDKLCEMAGDVYIRDMGYLGFPTYRIFVPVISANANKVDSARREDLSMRKFIHKLSPENCTITREQARKLADFIASNDTDKNANLTAGGNVPLPLLRAALLRDAGDITAAADLLREIDCGIEQYSCAAMELDLQSKGYEESVRDEMLNMFFDFMSADYAVKYWRGQSVVENIYKSVAARPSYVENNMMKEEKIQNQKDAVSHLHKKVKRKMIEGLRDQSKIKELFQ